MCLEHEQGRKPEQEQLFVTKPSDTPSPQVQIKPLESRLQIDGEMIKTHAEVGCQVAEEIKIPLDPVQPESALHANHSTSLPPNQNWDTSHLLSPPVTLHDLGPVASHLPSLCPSNSHLTNVTQRNALGRSGCPYQSRNVNKKGSSRYQRRCPTCCRRKYGWRCETGPEEASEEAKE